MSIAKIHQSQVVMGVFGQVKRTRFDELCYQRRINHWRILDGNGISGDELPGIGPYYPSEKELLADLDRYAEHYGCR